MPPTPKAETKKKGEKWYAWTQLNNGGEAGKVPVAGGRGERFVVSSRNITPLGEEVNESDFDPETWAAWVEGGSVRPYPLPEGVDEYTSPQQAFIANISTGKGEVDYDKLMELGLSNPAAGGYGEDEDEESEEVTQPVGA